MSEKTLRIPEREHDAGPTAQRPCNGLYPGRMYFDTDLGKPVWYKGPSWVDATGANA